MPLPTLGLTPARCSQGCLQPHPWAQAPGNVVACPWVTNALPLTPAPVVPTVLGSHSTGSMARPLKGTPRNPEILSKA